MSASMNLSAIEHMPRPRTIYTQICFCYNVAHGQTQEQILAELSQGLRRLTKVLPWLAGQVIEQEGIMSVAPLDGLPKLIAKDLTTEASAPTMQQLRDARFPFYMLDEKLICPRNTLSDGPNEDEKHPYPVMLLQANFVQGGMLLTILTCHSVMDIVGQVLIIKMLSKACNGEPLTDEEIAGCNIDRPSLISPLNDNEKEVDENRESSTFATPATSPDPLPVTETNPRLSWTYFQFSGSALRSLKASITSTLPESTPFVSTDDCICAILWHSLARIRLTRLDGSTNLNFLRQVDARSYMNIPATYPGNVVTSYTSSFTLAEVVSKSLGAIASDLRAQLNPKNLVRQIRAAAGRTQDQARQRQTPRSETKNRDRENTLTMSSWTKADCKDVDFNLALGKPVAVRRPMFTPIEGIIYLLPKGSDGEVAAALCLREDDRDGLRHDEEFRRWAEYIG